MAHGLQVAEAALAANRPDVARRLYRSLTERYPDAAAPRLRLAHIAFEQGDFRTARRHFVTAGQMPLDPAVHAEVWFAAGRAALALEDVPGAVAHFRRARAQAGGDAVAAWIANGLAVAATMQGDLTAAGAHYRDALAQDPENPRIAANYIRMLIEAGQIQQAADTYLERPASFWLDDDERALRLLLQERRGD